MRGTQTELLGSWWSFFSSSCVLRFLRSVLLAPVSSLWELKYLQGVLGLLSAVFGKQFFLECYNPLGEVMDLMALINGAVNFIIYSLMSTQFRKTLLILLPSKARPAAVLEEVRYCVEWGWEYFYKFIWKIFRSFRQKKLSYKLSIFGVAAQMKRLNIC